MDISSEYLFPIFISSTDYNLKDFRAELARYLQEIGYRPILSSAEGFPDSSPKLEPWESCIQVLDKCFVVILIVDGVYGTALNWPNLKEVTGGSKVSPTHGEYIFTHKNNKRMLVFVRKEIMVYYQSYRQTLKNCDNNESEAKNIITKTLPKYVDYETLKFIHEIKTTKPIPWIKEFDDITTVKKEVQKKMLNELAEIFHIKELKSEIVIDSFNKIIDNLGPEERKNVLTKINVAKEFIDAVDELEHLNAELQVTKHQLSQTEATNLEIKDKHEKKIRDLEKEIKKLEKRQNTDDHFVIKDGKIRIGDSNLFENYSNLINNTNSLISEYNVNSNYFLNTRKCDQCFQSVYSGLANNAIQLKLLNTCPSCKRALCSTCWPKRIDILDGLCPKCSSNISNLIKTPSTP